MLNTFVYPLARGSHLTASQFQVDFLFYIKRAALELANKKGTVTPKKGRNRA